jgi:SsrA-binding protein
LETIEAGIALRGTEVKSLRQGKGSIRDAFARIENGEAVLYNAHINEYSYGNINNHNPTAPRKLLLHKSEILRLQAQVNQKGYALIPLSMYWKNKKVKVNLALAKGKAQYDKRQDLREKETERTLRKIMMQKGKS